MLRERGSSRKTFAPVCSSAFLSAFAFLFSPAFVFAFAFACFCFAAVDLLDHNSRRGGWLALSVNLHLFIKNYIDVCIYIVNWSEIILILMAQKTTPFVIMNYIDIDIEGGKTCYWGFLLTSEWASERISACWCTCCPECKTIKIIMKFFIEILMVVYSEKDDDDEDDVDYYIIGAIRPSVCHKSDYFRPTIYLGPGRPS